MMQAIRRSFVIKKEATELGINISEGILKVLE